MHLCHGSACERQTSNGLSTRSSLAEGAGHIQEQGWRKECWQLAAQSLLWSLLMLFDLAGICCTLSSSWFLCKFWCLLCSALAVRSFLFIPCWNSPVPGACPRLLHHILQGEEAVTLLGEGAKLGQAGQSWTKAQVDVVYKKNPQDLGCFSLLLISLCCIRVFSLIHGSELAVWIRISSFQSNF